MVASTLAGAPAAHAASTCAAQGIAVAPLQSDTFYIDSATGVRYMGSYVGYRVTNTGASARNGLWERLENFSGGVVLPASGSAVGETLPVPDLAANANAPLYSYLKASGETTSAQRHDVVLYSGRPGAGGVEVCRETQTIARVSDVIKAAANKVETAVTSSTSVSLGGTFSLTVTGDAGTLGDGPATDLGVIRFSPAVTADWPSEAFRLVGVSHQIPTGTADVPDLLARRNMTGSPKYKVTYRFRAVGPTTAPTPVVPVQNIASGTQVKHTDPGTLGTLHPIPVVSSATTLAMSSPAGAHAPGATVPVTVTVRNGGGEVSIDELVVRLPGNWAYQSGSARRDGAAIADPHETTPTELHLVGPFTVAAGSNSSFQLNLTAGSAGTTGDATAVGTLGGGQLDSTLITTDDVPARTALSVFGSPVAHNDSFSVPVDATSGLDVLANDSVAGGTPTLEIVTPPANGTAIVRNGEMRYTPRAGYSGSDAITYRLNTEGGDSQADVAISVTPAAAPAPVSIASTGVGTTVQSRTVAIPAGGSVTLLDGSGQPATRVSVREGEYRIDPATGVITFTPVLGALGAATPVEYRVIDAAGASGSATYTPTITMPPVPAPSDTGSHGVGSQTQDATLPVPLGGTIVLIDRAGQPATLVDVPDEGTYALDASTGAISFVPAPGYSGPASGVAFRVIDAYGQAASARYLPVVALPPAPSAADVETTGPQETPQGTVLPVPAGATVRLISAGAAATRVYVSGEGAYDLDPSTGLLTFTPAPSFTGNARGVRYRISDAYGQSSEGIYLPRVTAASGPPPAAKTPAPTTPAPKAPAPRPAAPVTAVRADTLAVLPASDRVQVTCKSTRPMARCDITLTTRVGKRIVVVGRGSALAGGDKAVRVRVRLNQLGRSLTDQVGGTRLRIAGVVRGKDGVLSPVSGATRAVAKRVVAPRPVFFDTDSAQIRPAEMRYLIRLRRQLDAVRSISCVGYTDNRNSTGYNRDLGMARARAVCAVLKRGRQIAAIRVTRGETAPHADNQTTRGMQLNRRTQITLRY